MGSSRPLRVAIAMTLALEIAYELHDCRTRKSGGGGVALERLAAQAAAEVGVELKLKETA